jgi:hypothetical protein
MSVGAGDTMPFDYRVIVHDGTWSRERCARYGSTSA